MNRKIVGIIIIIIGLILLIGFIYFMFFYNSQELPKNAEEASNNANLPETTETITLPEKNGAIVNISQPAAATTTPEEKLKEDLKRQSSSFAERFGSFSNQSNYGNLEDLKIFMSAKMQAWSENYISREREINIDSSIYFGVITKSISSEIKKFDENSGTAEILVSTKKSETKGRENIANYYQNIILKFIKEKEVWKVDEANWQEKIYSRN